MSTIVFHYNRKNAQVVSVNASPSGNQQVYWSQIVFDIVGYSPNIPCYAYPLNTHMNVTTMIANDSVTTQETYTYNVSDGKNNTLGSIQYILNYVNTNRNLTTGNVSLNSTVFVASGIFSEFNGAFVNQIFNDVTGERTIRISRNNCGCKV
jgi:hypothetical protein